MQTMAETSSAGASYHRDGDKVTKSRAAVFGSSLALMLALFVVLPSVGADERNDKKDGRGVYRPLTLFTEVLQLVMSNYVEPVETKQLMSGAFSGMTEAMDPFAEYIPPERISAFNAAQTAREKHEVQDVGVVLARRLGYPVVIAAIPGSPAATAGLKGDDVIEKIDGQSTRGLSIWEADSRLSGKPGGRVSVLVLREGAKPKKRTIDIVRSSWKAEAPSLARTEGTTVVKIPSFAPGTTAALKGLIASFDRTKPLVLDLRGNAMGTFEEGSDAAALFVPAGTVGELKGRKIETKTFKAEAGQRVHESKLVVLVDSGTAGAAELFAAALREAGRKPAPVAAAGADHVDDEVPPVDKANAATRLVGEPTPGMGFSTQVIRLASGGALKMSVGKLRTAGGRALSPRGLDPDDRVFPLREEEKGKQPVDLILQRGLKVLAEITAVKAAA